MGLPHYSFSHPLNSACGWKRTAALLIILAGGAVSMARAEEAPGALREAVQRGDPTEVTRLIATAPAEQRDQDAADVLVWSAFYGKLDVLNIMLRSHLPVTVTDEHGNTALMAAVRGNQPAAVDILLAHGANAEAPSANGGPSAAALATQLGRAGIVEQLHRAGSTTAGRGTANTFAAAVQDERLEAIKTFLADPTFRVNGKAAQDALLLAIQRNEAALALALLDHGASANEPGGPVGVTPLVAAAATGNAELARVLLEHGADPDRPPPIRGKTPLEAAIYARAEQVALLLARHAAQTHHPLKTSLPLFFAIGSGLPTLVEPLVAAGADVNAVNGEGATPLMWAVARCHAAVDPLLALHPRLDLRDRAGRSVFDLPDGAWLAEKMRQSGTGAQADAVRAAPHRSREQLTDDLLAAVKKGDAPAVKTLLDQGADPQSCNKLKWPVAVLAASLGYTEILRLLYEKDHDTIWQTAPGRWSPLLEAAGNGHLETVRFLLAHHAEPEVVNDFGATPLDCAESRHYPEVAQVLRDAQSPPQASR